MTTMRVELLFLRWLLAIALVALGVAYATSSRPARPTAQYETVPLVRGGRSSGLPLAGIMVDPTQRDIYAVVGGPTVDSGASKSRFFIVWKGEEGQTYATTFPRGESKPDAMFEISPSRDIREVLSFREDGATKDAPEVTSLADAKNLLRTIVDALPPVGVVSQQP